MVLFVVGVTAQEPKLNMPLQYAKPMPFSKAPLAVTSISHVLFAPLSETFYVSGKQKSDESVGVWSSSRNKNGWSTPIKDDEVFNLQTTTTIAGINQKEDVVYLLTRDKKDRVVELFSRKRMSSGWDAPLNIPLPPLVKNDLVHDIVVHPDETVMILTISNKRLRYGKDLYVSLKNSKGNWEAPEHLGFEVNSSLDELSPFLSDDKKTLFFSSMGHFNYGGADIFKANRVGEAWTKWTQPENLGNSINGPLDDGAFAMNSNYEIFFVNGLNTSSCKLMKSSIMNTEKTKHLFPLVALTENHLSKEQLQQMMTNNQIIYNKNIQTADSLFALSELEKASNYYLNAHGAFPDSTYPKSQLDKIDVTLHPEIAQRDSFNIHVMSGAEKFHKGDFKGALLEYRKALQIRNDESVKQKVKDVQSFIASENQANLEKESGKK